MSSPIPSSGGYPTTTGGLFKSSFGLSRERRTSARFWQLWGISRLLLLLLLLPTLAYTADSKLSGPERTQIIRGFLAERPWVHRVLPRSKEGIRIEEGGKIVPSEADLNRLVSELGSAAKPGDRVKITAVRFIRHGIEFEINGGPVKKKKWSDHIQIGVNGMTPPQAKSDDQLYSETNGSVVFLILKDEASVTTDHIKDMLAPVLDFKSMSQVEAYQKSLSPVLAAAVKNHHALVGMDKDMVLFALGRPQQRLHETKDGQDYDEWIYGTPPQQVEFIRFVGDKSVRIEDMKVSGEKVVRTQDEVGNAGGTLDASAQKNSRPGSASAPAGATASDDQERRTAPTLLRPGEKQSTPDDARDPAPMPSPDPQSPQSPGPGSSGPN